jgi:hypothetical protein
MSRALGKKHWAIAAGRIPLVTTGPEPAMTSRDELRFLNIGDADVNVEITVIYTDRDPIGPYRIKVAARRVRRVRVNDLIDPLPVPLETDYALTIESAEPIVVQFTKIDTSSSRNAAMGTMAFG